VSKHLILVPAHHDLQCASISSPNVWSTNLESHMPKSHYMSLRSTRSRPCKDPPIPALSGCGRWTLTDYMDLTQIFPLSHDHTHVERLALQILGRKTHLQRSYPRATGTQHTVISQHVILRGPNTGLGSARSGTELRTVSRYMGW